MPRPNKRHTLIYPAAQADDEPFERTATGQQNFVRQQPGGSTLEELAWPLGSGPAQTVEPACQPKADQRFCHVAVTVVLANFGDVFPTLLAGPISLQTLAGGKTQLAYLYR